METWAELGPAGGAPAVCPGPCEPLPRPPCATAAARDGARAAQVRVRRPRSRGLRDSQATGLDRRRELLSGGGGPRLDREAEKVTLSARRAGTGCSVLVTPGTGREQEESGDTCEAKQDAVEAGRVGSGGVWSSC